MALHIKHNLKAMILGQKNVFISDFILIEVFMELIYRVIQGQSKRIHVFLFSFLNNILFSFKSDNGKLSLWHVIASANKHR